MERKNSEMFDNKEAEPDEGDLLDEVQNKLDIIDEDQLELEANNNDIEHEVQEDDDLDRAEANE